MPTPKLTTPDRQLRRRLAGVLRRHRHLAKAVGQKIDYDLDYLLYLVQSNPTCEYCKLPYALDDLQFDHKTPIARGGVMSLPNLCCSCRRCNELKGSLHADEYMALRRFLRTLHPAAAEDLERRLIAGGAVHAKGRTRKTYR